MQSNINSLAICILGLAFGYGYHNINATLSSMKRDLVREINARDSAVDKNYQRVNVLKEMIDNTRLELHTVEKKVDKYLDIENPFNVSMGGDEV